MVPTLQWGGSDRELRLGSWSLQAGNRAGGEVREAGRGQTPSVFAGKDKKFGSHSKGNKRH